MCQGRQVNSQWLFSILLLSVLQLPMGQLLLLMALRISLVMQSLKCKASVISLRKMLTTTPEITTFLQLLAKHHKVVSGKQQ